MYMSEFQPGAYDVERMVFSGKFREHHHRRDGMALPDQIEMSNMLLDHFGFPRPTYRRRGGKPNYASHVYTSRGEHGEVTYGALAGPAIVCHEVAHILAKADDTRKDGYSHGPVWQEHYVACVEIVLGPWQAKRLAKAFAEFEADKVVNKAKAAVKRGKRRSTLKSGPRVRTVVRSEISEKLRTRQYGGVTLTWGKNSERCFASRYSTNKGGYWQVSGYPKVSDAWSDRYSWESLAKGVDGALFTERQFSTKVEALEWAVQWSQR